MLSPYATATLLPGSFLGPKLCGTYPLDLDGSLRFTRPPSGITIFPYPPVIGYIQGLLPMQDNLIRAGMYGKSAYGPWTAPAQIDAAGRLFMAQDTKMISPELPKVQG